MHDSCIVDWIRPVFRQSCYPVHAAIMILVNTFWWKFGTAEIAGTWVRYFQIMTVTFVTKSTLLMFYVYFFLNTDIAYGCHNSLLISDFILGTRIFGRKMAAVSVQRAGANLASGCCRREGGIVIGSELSS